MRDNLIRRIQAAERFLDIHRPLFREIVTELRMLRAWLTITVAFTIITLLVVSGAIIVSAVVEYNDMGTQAYTKPMTLVESCAHLYNRDRHNEWIDCMNVGYK